MQQVYVNNTTMKLVRCDGENSRLQSFSGFLIGCKTWHNSRLKSLCAKLRPAKILKPIIFVILGVLFSYTKVEAYEVWKPCKKEYSFIELLDSFFKADQTNKNSKENHTTKNTNSQTNNKKFITKEQKKYTEKNKYNNKTSQ